jgi:protein-tyrosine phosphatase
MKVLFVCLGNICRSPLAEAVFIHQICERGLDIHFSAESCGTANYHIGDNPDPRTIKNALKNGVKIDHIGRQLCEEDLEKFDLILAMDASNLANIMRVPGAAKHKSKIKMMRWYDPHLKDGDVPDPYYGSEKDFQEVFDILNRSMKGLIAELESQFRKNDH